MELFWEADYVDVRPGRETRLRNRPERRPAVGVPARRMYHLNLMTLHAGVCRNFLVETLGFRETERVDLPDGSVLASFLSVTNLSHDIALVPDRSEKPGRFHRLCYCCSSTQHLFDLAELAREHGIVVQHGPGRHGIGGATFLFLFEPGIPDT